MTAAGTVLATERRVSRGTEGGWKVAPGHSAEV